MLCFEVGNDRFESYYDRDLLEQNDEYGEYYQFLGVEFNGVIVEIFLGNDGFEVDEVG